jgi:hypothetical protein
MPVVNVVESFGGIVPRLAPHLLPQNGAQVANNVKLYSNTIRPWKVPLNVSATLKTGTIQSIFLYEKQYWLNWTTDVDVVRSPIGGDMYKRIYWTGDVEPRMSAFGLVNQSAPYPSGCYKLGIPAPIHAPQVTRNGAVGQEQYKKTRAYCYTYVSNYGEEGPPSPVSALVDWYPQAGSPPTDNTVTLSQIDSAPTGNYYITSINIYRTNTGSTETDYQFVAALPVGQTSYTDAVADAALGLILPSSSWDPPPSDLKGLISLPCGALAGFHSNEVCFSEVYLPHAWPVDYRIAVDWPIVSIGVYGTSILVMTEGFPFLIIGSAPGQMTRQKLEVGHACVSRRGVVDMGYGIIYPCPDGLVLAGTTTLDVATKPLMTRDDWRKFNPSSIHACYYNGCYIGFYNTGTVTGGFIFDPVNTTFSTLDTYATTAFRDILTDSMYIVTQSGGVNYLQSWDAGSANIGYTWRSKPFHNPFPMNLGVAQVLADDFSNVSIEIFADGVSRYHASVLNDDAFHLTAGFRAHKYEFQLTGTSPVNKVYLGDVMTSVAGV